MGVLRVIRNKRNQACYMQRLIQYIWDQPNVICKYSCGCANHANAIIAAFEMVQRAYARLVVPVHCFQLVLEPGTRLPEAQAYVEKVHQYFNENYQTVAVLYYNEEGLLESTFVLNAVSYKNGSIFHDNNNAYLDLLRILNGFSNQGWNIEAENSVFFTNEDNNANCYQDISGKI